MEDVERGRGGREDVEGKGGDRRGRGEYSIRYKIYNNSIYMYNI